MIERIELFKLQDVHATDEGRAAAHRMSREALAEAPGYTELRVGLPADPDSLRSWDLSLVVRFDDLESERVYLESESYVTHDAELMKRSIVKKHWSFEIQITNREARSESPR